MSSSKTSKSPVAQTSAPQAPEDPIKIKHEKPMVIISGAGIAGLTLAVLLQKARIPYAVFERARAIKPLGSFIFLGPLTGPLFKQLGIYDEFVALGKEHTLSQVYTEDLKPAFDMAIEWAEDLTGYKQYNISRPELYDLLLRQIPAQRINLGKRILSYTELPEGVMIQCSDNSQYIGNILVGADGAYSAVRHQLYSNLKKDSQLPLCDDVSLPYSCACLVGQTVILDPEEFPEVKEEKCESNIVLGRDSQCTWCTATTKKNRVCWMVIQYLNKHTYKDNDTFRTTEWGPECAEALAKEVREFKLPGLRNGQPRTLGDYVDRTPPQNMSKVILEEIVFETWYGGRAVLIGDACHKMNPSGGVGASHAMLDAVTLANWISTLRYPEQDDLTEIFKEYRKERYPVAKEAFATSQMFRMSLGKDIPSQMTRSVIKRMPVWLWKLLAKKMAKARFQASFLPLVHDTAKAKARHQPSLKKTMAIHKKNAEELAKADDDDKKDQDEVAA
ncbi:hypothetical protein BGZ94_000483, partial [Podila epigama]